MNIHLLQQSLIKTCKILAGKNVKVVMEGFAPCVKFDTRTRKPTEICIPALPIGSSIQLVQAIHGYIDHECAHILESDHNDITDTSRNDLWHYIHNCIDDVYINRQLGKRFIGSGSNIRTGYQYLFDGKENEEGPNPYSREFVDEYEGAEGTELLKFQFSYVSLFFAAKMGDLLSGDKYDELELDRFYQDIIDEADPDMLARLKNCNSTTDVRELTDYWHKYFSEDLAKKAAKAQGFEGDGKATESILKETTEGLKSLEDQLASKIKMQVQALAAESEEGFYWTDRFDIKISKKEMVERCIPRFIECGLAEFEDETKGITNYLTKDLRRLLEERRRRYYIGGYKSGKMNAKALYSVRTGNDRIFKKKNEIRDINSAVSLLIDLSGSMQSEKVYVAMQSAYAFAMVLNQLKVPYEIYGFSTQNPTGSMRNAFNDFMKDIDTDLYGKIINHSSPENFWAFKEFDEAFDYHTKQAMYIAAGSGVGMMQNEDSKHIKLALERLSVRPEKTKALFVFSDGSPCFMGESVKNSGNQLHYLAHNAKDLYGVDIYAIGIQSDSVSRFYKQNKVINSLPQLPNALFEFLRKVF